MKKIIFILSITFLFSCNTESSKSNQVKIKNQTSFFERVGAVKSGNEDLILPKGYQYEVLYQGGKDSVIMADNKKVLSKKSNDMLAYIPIEGSSEHGYLYTSHETFASHPVLGDGGGGAIMEIKKENESWKRIGDVRHIDFSSVRGTSRNCGGTVTPYGTILSCEELQPMSNEELHYQGRAFKDTTDLENGMKAFENQGWMVEIDPKSAKAIHKLYSMGRYMHEDVHCMADGKTVYLSDDNDPAVFFKFISDTVNNYAKGQLYAYKQSNNGGEWITLPRDTVSLIKIRSVALEMGATLFIRHEWMELIDGKLYIAETGKDEFDWSSYMANSSPAKHFILNDDKTINDPYGRILVFNPDDNSMEVHLEGGTSTLDSKTNFSNPDCIVKFEREGRKYLMMSEDLVGTTQNRISKEAVEEGEKYCEVYILDMEIKNPTVDDLVRFAVSPNGSETTGDCFTPDGKTLFLNVQHPSSKNKAPFNFSTTVAIQGF